MVRGFVVALGSIERFTIAACPPVPAAYTVPTKLPGGACAAELTLPSSRPFSTLLPQEHNAATTRKLLRECLDISMTFGR
jgi:hypothetical protein